MDASRSLDYESESHKGEYTVLAYTFTERLPKMTENDIFSINGLLHCVIS